MGESNMKQFIISELGQPEAFFEFLELAMNFILANWRLNVASERVAVRGDLYGK